MADGKKKLYIIAGCNGAGKTTASLSILPEVLDCQEFVNADEIARGLSPLNPYSMAIDAGKLMKQRFDQLVEGDTNFAMETNHWEYTDKKSHVTIVIENYATDHGYMDKDEWKAKKKELKAEYKKDYIQKLNAHAARHGIPALSPSVQRAIKNLKFKIE